MITQIKCGNEVRHVDFLSSGEHGSCPHCGAEMFVKASKNGVKFAALMPGKKHTSETCLAQEKRSVSYEPQKTSVKAFFSNLMETPQGKNSSESTSPVSVKTPTRDEDAPKKRIERKLASLKTIWKEKLQHLGYEYNLGGKSLAKFLFFRNLPNVSFVKTPVKAIMFSMQAFLDALTEPNLLFSEQFGTTVGQSP